MKKNAFTIIKEPSGAKKVTVVDNAQQFQLLGFHNRQNAHNSGALVG